MSVNKTFTHVQEQKEAMSRLSTYIPSSLKLLLHSKWFLLYQQYYSKEESWCKFMIKCSIQNYFRQFTKNLSFSFQWQCVKSVRIWSFSGPYCPIFGLNTERKSVSLRIQSECGKIQTRKLKIRSVKYITHRLGNVLLFLNLIVSVFLEFEKKMIKVFGKNTLMFWHKIPLMVNSMISKL